MPHPNGQDADLLTGLNRLGKTSVLRLDAATCSPGSPGGYPDIDLLLLTRLLALSLAPARSMEATLSSITCPVDVPSPSMRP